MTTLNPRLKTGLALAAALALVCACDANHVLGKADTMNTGAAGTAGGSTGAAGTSPASTGEAGAPFGATGAAGAGSAANGGGTTAADAGVGATGAGGAVAVGSGSGGMGGMKVMAGPLGPPQSWTGYIEQRMFSSGSDVLKLTFATDASGIAKGTIAFGMGTPPPPATDPNVGYPPAFAAVSMGGFDLAHTANDYIAEGYSYTFDGGTLETHRLRFTVDLAQVWAKWCALQKPATDPASRCFPNAGGSSSQTECDQTNPVSGQTVMIDCGVFALCAVSSPCACSASSCGLAGTSSFGAAFDVFLSADTLNGSVVGEAFSMNNVHFVKD